MMLQAQQRRVQSYGLAGFGIVVTLILLCALLAACGSYIPSQAGESQASSTSNPALIPSPTHPHQQAQNCGKVDTTLNGKPLDAKQARLAGNCFWQAFQNCQAASLLLRVHSLDTGANHAFTMKGTHGACLIVDTVTHYIVPNNLNTTRSYTCSGLVMQADGLHFIACGSLGNIVMPV
jgi:hypothetical protein